MPNENSYHYEFTDSMEHLHLTASEWTCMITLKNLAVEFYTLLYSPCIPSSSGGAKKLRFVDLVLLTELPWNTLHGCSLCCTLKVSPKLFFF